MQGCMVFLSHELENQWLTYWTFLLSHSPSICGQRGPRMSELWTCVVL